MKTLTATLCVLMLLSCSSKKEQTQEGNDPYLMEGYEYVHLIPDSLRTPEQQKMLELLQKTITSHISVKDNQMYFNLSEEEFVALGLPKPYYDLIQKDMKNNNEFIKKNGIENVDSMLYNSYKELYKKYNFHPDYLKNDSLPSSTEE